MAHLPSALACQVSRAASSDLPLDWTAKSMIVVVPPQAAARVPVSKVSLDRVPPNGISICVCASIPPGSTYLPVASITRSAADAQEAASSVPGAASPAIRSSSARTSMAVAPVVATTVPPLIRIRISASGSWLGQRPVGVRAPVPVEGP